MTHRCLLALCLASLPVLAQAAGEAAPAVGAVSLASASVALPGTSAEPEAVAGEAGVAVEEGVADATGPEPATDGAAAAAGLGGAKATPATGADTTAAAAASAKTEGGPDPWEGFNRSVYRFNDRIDRHVLKPVAKGYQKVTPRAVRTGVTNFFRNLKMPVVMLNDLLQGKPLAAGQDLSRFVVNSTIGIVGVFDPSTKFGIPRNDEDFGQTLGRWGVASGPYLVLPFLGPSSVRDGAGFGVDVVTDPITFEFDEGVTGGLWAIKLVNTRANLLDVEEIMQGDRYLFLRDLYLQSREFAVKDGRVESDPFLDEEEPGEESSGDEEPAGEDGEGSVPADGAAAPDAAEPPADAGAVEDSTAAQLPSVGAAAADAAPEE